jgi:hypothetical protein
MFLKAYNFLARSPFKGETRPSSAQPRRCALLSSSICSPTPLMVFVAVALLNLIFFGALLIFLVPDYETNDDLAMQLVASGFYTGHPSEYLVFTSFAIGWMLRLLYEFSGAFNWYLLYLVAVHFVSVTTIGFLILRRRWTLSFILLYAGFLLLVELHQLLSLQFTTTAFIAGTAGVLLLVDALEPVHPINWLKTFIGFGFTGLMLLIREPVGPFLAIVACPFVIERFGLRGLRRLLTVGSTCIALGIVIHETNHWYFQREPAWAEFSEYNDLRGRIHRTVLEAHLMEAAPGVGWTKNDAEMFHNWYFAEPEVFGSVSKMRHLYNHLQMLAKTNVAPRHARLRWSNLFLPKLLAGDAGALMSIAILNAGWFLIVSRQPRARYVISLLGTYVVCVTLALYLAYTARLPQRLSINLPILMQVVCLYWAAASTHFQVALRFRGFERLLSWIPRLEPCLVPVRQLVPLWVVLNVFLVVGVVHSLWTMNARNRELRAVSRMVDAPLRELASGKKLLLVTMPLDSVFEQSLAFYPASRARSFTVLPYGWLSHSPIFSEILNANHLRPYSMSLVDNAGAFFLMQPHWLEPLQVFYQEHYHERIKFDCVLNSDEHPSYRACGFRLYQAHIASDRMADAANGLSLSEPNMEIRSDAE